MNKEAAEKLLNNIEIEMKNTGGVSFKTSATLESAFKSIGKDYLDYLYMENGKLIFNSRRFKRNFIENNQIEESTINVINDLQAMNDEIKISDEKAKQYDAEIIRLQNKIGELNK